MHISLSEEGQLDDSPNPVKNTSVTTIGAGGITVAHNMVDMRHQSLSCTNIATESHITGSKMAERLRVTPGGGDSVVVVAGDLGGSTVVAIDTTAVQRRPSHSSLSSSSSDERLNSSSHRTFREVRNKMKPVVVGAPDLVMDLPVSSLSSSPRDHASSASPSPSSSPRARSTSPHKNYAEVPPVTETATGSPSPDMTAAECFAKQNQSTLKKTPVPKTATLIHSDAQTQTLLQAKSALSVMKSSSIDVSQLAELKITENEDAKPSSIVQQRSVDVSSLRCDTTESPLVEVRSAAPPHPITPNTPKLAARYLQAVAAASGSPATAAVVPKPQVRVKPTVLKKPSVSPGDSDNEQHTAAAK